MSARDRCTKEETKGMRFRCTWMRPNRTNECRVILLTHTWNCPREFLCSSVPVSPSPSVTTSKSNVIIIYAIVCVISLLFSSKILLFWLLLSLSHSLAVSPAYSAPGTWRTLHSEVALSWLEWMAFHLGLLFCLLLAPLVANIIIWNSLAQKHNAQFLDFDGNCSHRPQR